MILIRIFLVLFYTIVGIKFILAYYGKEHLLILLDMEENEDIKVLDKERANEPLEERPFDIGDVYLSIGTALAMLLGIYISNLFVSSLFSLL